MSTEPTGAAVPRDETPRQIAARLRSEGMSCNCDLDRWQPEPITGHSWVCRIHKAAIAKATGQEGR